MDEEREPPRGVSVDVGATVINPHAGTVADNVAGELDARQFAPVVRGRNFGLVDRDDGAQEAHAKTTDDAAEDQVGHLGGERLNEAAQDEHEGAVADRASAAPFLAQTADHEGADERADLKDRHHVTDGRTRRIVEVVLEIHAGDDAGHDTLVVAEQEHAERHEHGREVEQSAAGEKGVFDLQMVVVAGRDDLRVVCTAVRAVVVHGRVAVLVEHAHAAALQTVCVWGVDVVLVDVWFFVGQRREIGLFVLVIEALGAHVALVDWERGRLLARGACGRIGV